MKICSNFSTEKLSYFRMKGKVAKYCEVKNEEELLEAIKIAHQLGKKILPLGAGSNSILAGNINLFAIKFKSAKNSKQRNIKIIRRNKSFVLIEASAGVVFNDLVKHCTKAGFAGLENLSAIPGTVGAAPVQNIGAYGSEIADSIISVRALDLHSLKFLNLNREVCCFKYRDSLFKRNPGRHFITSVVLKLRRESPEKILKISREVASKRRAKLPDWRHEPNVGSFFENPIVSNAIAKKLLKGNSTMPHFPVEEKIKSKKIQKTKLYAGWLIENAGLKGYTKYGLQISPKNALILVNKKCSSKTSLLKFIKLIQEKVRTKFGISLTPEPNIF